MSQLEYLSRITEVITKIGETQKDNILKAAEAFAKSMQSGGRVYMFGSGHSVIPVMDIFPRYGSFVGFFPIYDPRLMWSNVIGPGGARELLWLERREGYAEIVLGSYEINSVDSVLVFSHGGLNAAPIEVAMGAKKRGATVVTVSSLANYKQAEARHSTGKKLSDAGDIAIDNCVPPEDALVAADGIPEKFAAGSTIAAVSIAMSLVSETGKLLVKSGVRPFTFVSPNVGLSPDHNDQVYAEFTRRYFNKK
jgi:uncharacterized phosphosugar-binding protein